MGKYISGFGTKDNLRDWADYAKGNSYTLDKAQLKHDIGCDGCDQDIEEGIPGMPKQKQSEGRGWADMDKVTVDSTFTGKRGSKRKD